MKGRPNNMTYTEQRVITLERGVGLKSNEVAQGHSSRVAKVFIGEKDGQGEVVK